MFNPRDTADSFATTSAGSRISFRPAVRGDCRTLAKLYRQSSSGVADYCWHKCGRAGETILDTGTRHYASEHPALSYRRCIVAECDGRVVGMLHSYAALDHRREAVAEIDDPVLAPYGALELTLSHSLLLACCTVHPQFRRRGIGSRLIAMAMDGASYKPSQSLCMLAYEGNAPALRLLRRHGFTELARRAVVSHPLIVYGGDVMLMQAAPRKNSPAG